MAMTMRERIELAMRRKIKVDATGLAPAVASTLLVGFDEAADAVLAELETPTDGMAKEGNEAWDRWCALVDDQDYEHCVKMIFAAAIRAAREGK